MRSTVRPKPPAFAVNIIRPGGLEAIEPANKNAARVLVEEAPLSRSCENLKN